MVFNSVTSSSVEKIMNKIIFLVDSFISQFPKLVTVFKCYKVYWSNDQDKICYETKSLKMIVLYSFQYIGNELDQFYLHKTDLIFFYKYSNILSSNQITLVHH
jgi:hypothetical protein